MKIFQIINVLRTGDAMGNHAIMTHKALEKAGYTVVTAALANESGGAIEVVPYRDDLEISNQDLILYQYGAYAPISDSIFNYPCRKVLVYHNITPYHYFLRYDRNLLFATYKGRRDVEAFCKFGSVSSAIVDSDYNAEELIGFGMKREKVHTIDLFMPNLECCVAPDEGTIAKYRDGKTNILFVGRLSPNKKQSDLITAFAYYQRHYNPDSRLILVGGGKDSLYGLALQEYVEKLACKNVLFTDFVNDRELAAFYSVSELFVSMSEHEGFGIPLIEAMKYRLPVIAYSAAAVPDTLKGSGVLLQDKDPYLTASWINRLVEDRELRDEVIEGEINRVQNFSNDRTEKNFIDCIKEIVSEIQNTEAPVIPTQIDGAIYDFVSGELDRNGKKLQYSRKEYLERINNRMS